jgi:Uri superfamily endonuclease
MELPLPASIEIGRLGDVQLESGLHAYVGSALGPGGLAARLLRHVRGSARRHWHMDHLRPHVLIRGALIATGTRRVECMWATWLSQMAEACIAGFGASDCACSGHLFRIGSADTRDPFVTQACTELGVALAPLADA